MVESLTIRQEIGLRRVELSDECHALMAPKQLSVTDERAIYGPSDSQAVGDARAGTVI
jgi:hypothetical protein